MAADRTGRIVMNDAAHTRTVLSAAAALLRRCRHEPGRQIDHLFWVWRGWRARKSDMTAHAQQIHAALKAAIARRRAS